MVHHQDRSVDAAGKNEEDFVLLDRPVKVTDEIPAVFRLPSLNGIELHEITVSQLQQYFAQNCFTSREYAQFCIESIRKANPYLGCVIEINPDALDIAAALDEERRQVGARGSLHGVPVLLKDNIATSDKMETTAGSLALLGSKVPKDAHIVGLLRSAGAVILGKTNMDEFAGLRSHSYSCGWSGRGGQCRNPYRLNRSPNGSSSGSAVAVSANLVPLSFGTETDCSITAPASVCGVVGFKPSVGLTSRAGVIPISDTQDSLGPLGRTVSDCARALDVIAGVDDEDSFTAAIKREQFVSYEEALSTRNILADGKFGIPMNRFWESAPAQQRRVVERVLSIMQAAGAKIYEVEMPCAEERLAENGEWDWRHHEDDKPETSEITVMKVQAYRLMNEYLSKLENTSMKTLGDIVRYNDENRGSEGGHPYDIPAFPDGQPLFREVLSLQGRESPTYHAALKYTQYQCRENGIDAALKHDGSMLDALLFCDVKRGGIQIAAQAGYPVLSIPVGLDPDGMPVALVLIQTAWQDHKLIRWGSAIEDLLVHHQARAERKHGGRPLPRDRRVGRVPPVFSDHMRKNIPVDNTYRYLGALHEAPDPWPTRMADPDLSRENPGVNIPSRSGQTAANYLA